MIAWSLVAVSLACGGSVMWVFRHTVDLAALRMIRRRIEAHLLEFRLFFDEPALIWQAQKALLAGNARLLLLLWRAFVILALPMAWLCTQLDSIYGMGPLPIGQAAVVTAQMGSPAGGARVFLETPPGIAIETPAVWSESDRQFSWRVRPLRPVCGSLRFTLGASRIGKAVAAGERPVFLVRRRARPLLQFLLHPEEPRLPAGGFLWLEVDYPRADVRLCGLTLPWIAWFLFFSTASAFGFARWLRVPLL